jgi:hypothetical protein
MAQPLLATYRLVIEYQIEGVLHTLHMYCSVDNPTAATPDIIARDGTTDMPWDDVADDVWDFLRVHFNTGAVDSAAAKLEQFDDPVWNSIAFHTLTGAGSSSAATKKAQQTTYVLRDSAFFKVKFILMETVNDYIGHVGTGYGLGTDMNALTEALDGTNPDAHAFYNWLKSRGNRYLITNGVVAGLTFDLNDKLKRTRGLE